MVRPRRQPPHVLANMIAVRHLAELLFPADFCSRIFRRVSAQRVSRVDGISCKCNEADSSNWQTHTLFLTEVVNRYWGCWRLRDCNTIAQTGVDAAPSTAGSSFLSREAPNLRHSSPTRILIPMPDTSVVAPGLLDSAPIVEHFRDGRFFNPGVTDHDFRTALHWMTHRKIGPWRRWVDSTPGPPPPVQIEGPALRVTFVNHSTVLLQTGGLNILTDPVWSRRVSPVSFTGPQRHRAPGIGLENLPPIHCLLISHNHYDHYDIPTLRRIAAAHRPAVFCPLGLAAPLRQLGFSNVRELDWWQSHAWGGVGVYCVPAQHFSARTPFDRNRTLWCGWVLETPHGNLYFAGDTGFCNVFAALRERLSRFRLALLPIGAYEPEWFMGPIHMTPEQAVEARSLLDASTAIAIHFGTFALADDGETEPVDRLVRALNARGDRNRFWVLSEGEDRLVP